MKSTGTRSHLDTKSSEERADLANIRADLANVHVLCKTTLGKLVAALPVPQGGAVPLFSGPDTPEIMPSGSPDFSLLHGDVEDPARRWKDPHAASTEDVCGPRDRTRPE